MTALPAFHLRSREPHDSGSSRGRVRYLLAGAPIALLGALSLALSLPETKTLSAGGYARIDSDGDGLSDIQEVVLGTSSDLSDTDLDGWGDVEELARGSDPLEAASVPGAMEVDVQMYASSEGSFVSLNSALFLPPNSLSELSFQMGVFVGGQPLFFTQDHVNGLSRGFLIPGREAGTHIAILEVGVPEWLVHSLGQVSFFAAVSADAQASGPTSVAVANLASIDGILTSIEPTNGQDGDDSGAQGSSPEGAPSDGPGGGVLYRPLVDDNRLPVTWTSGQVCFQSLTPAGTNGSNIIYEVLSADCVPLDSSCNSGGCAGSVGQPVELPDPGTLLGG